MSRDVSATISPVSSLAPAARTASANGASADLSGYDAAVVMIAHGTTTDGTFVWTVEESDDNSTFATVAAGDLSATLSNTTSATTSGTVKRATYTGSKRYIRAVVTASGTTTGGVHSATILRAKPRTQPTA